MLFKSALMTAASGSVRGLTASHNRAGQYFRGRTIPVNTNTSQQQTVRSALTSVVAGWSGDLTDGQRDAWASYGAEVGTVTALGDTIPLSGISAFVQGNVPRVQNGLTRVDDGPSVLSKPDFGAIENLVISEATQTLTFTFNDNFLWTGQDDGGLIVQISRPQNPGVNYFSGPYRLALLIPGSVATPATSPASVPVPFTLSEGQKAFVRMRVTRADGRLSGTFSGGLTVGA